MSSTHLSEDPDIEGPDAEAVSARPAGAVVRDSLAVGIAVGLSGVAFGVAGTAAHLTAWQICAMSLLMFTGASQFALAGSLAARAAPAAAVAGALFLGVRNAFYGLRLAERLALPSALRPLAAQWVIDETTAVTLAQPDRRAARIGFTVTGATLYVLWNLTTLAGALGTSMLDLGDPSRYGLDAAGPAVFLALLAPRLAGRRERSVAAVGVVLALAGTLVLPAGVPVLLAVAAVPMVLGAERLRGADR
jgi:predicted branched-subunit amino acid permease